MKLYLFGGAEVELGQVPILQQQINDIIQEIKPAQLLHVPFARTVGPPGEDSAWPEGWVRKAFDLSGIELLDARDQNDLQKAVNPLIFINGGSQHTALLDAITQNKKLHELIMNAEVIIGESAGAKVLGYFQRYTNKNGESSIGPGLGILPSTIIEPHYTQRNRHQLLRDEIKITGAKVGIGIDSVTAIVLDTKKYPGPYSVIGEGLVEVLQ